MENIEYTDYDINYLVTEYVQDGNHMSNIDEVIIGYTVIYSVICLLGIIGNSLVIWFGIFRMKKTVNVVWYLNLAVADFSLTFFCPLEITQLLLGYWPFEKMMCTLYSLVIHTSLLVNVLQITVIGVDRCICVVFPVWCHNHRRPRLASIIVLIFWKISFTVAVLYTINIDMDNMYEGICTLDLDKSILLTVLEFVFFLLLPFIIVVSCYIVIVLYIKRKHSLTSSRLLKTNMAVIVAFFICWFPFRLFSLLYMLEITYSFYVYNYLFLIASLLLDINSCINPILYVFIGRDLEETFCGSFQARLENAFIE